MQHLLATKSKILEISRVDEISMRWKWEVWLPCCSGAASQPQPLGSFLVWKQHIWVFFIVSLVTRFYLAILLANLKFLVLVSICKTKAPYEVACFSWLEANNACLTHENLQRRGIYVAGVNMWGGSWNYESFVYLLQGNNNTFDTYFLT